MYEIIKELKYNERYFIQRQMIDSGNIKEQYSFNQVERKNRCGDD